LSVIISDVLSPGVNVNGMGFCAVHAARERRAWLV
jgi:hypothetical protein